MAKIVIIGLGTSGFAAILAAKKTDRKADITVFDEKDYDLMHPCGLPYAVEGLIDSFDKLKHPLNLSKMKVGHHSSCKAVSLDIAGKKVRADTKDGRTVEENYERLIISTGAAPFIPPVPGLRENEGRLVFSISTPEDAKALSDVARPGMKAICLGAGAIGLESAVALKERGLDVTVIEMLESVFPRALDPDMSELVKLHLEESGIKILCGKKVEMVNVKEGRIESVIVNGDEIETDIIVAAAGVRARMEMAASAGIKTGNSGIIVNEKMETSIPGVYAAGDCAQTKSAIDGNDFTLQLSTTAYRMGTVAGTNAAGGTAEYPGITGAFVSKIGSLEAAAVGYTSVFAEKLGYKIVFGKIKDTTLYDWYPGGEPLTVKIIADDVTGNVLGAQAVGSTGAASRVNIASVAIKARMNLEDMSELELAYCPPVSQAYDAIIKAVDLAARKRKCC